MAAPGTQTEPPAGTCDARPLWSSRKHRDAPPPGPLGGHTLPQDPRVQPPPRRPPQDEPCTGFLFSPTHFPTRVRASGTLSEISYSHSNLASSPVPGDLVQSTLHAHTCTPKARAALSWQEGAMATGGARRSQCAPACATRWTRGRGFQATRECCANRRERSGRSHPAHSARHVPSEAQKHHVQA